MAMRFRGLSNNLASSKVAQPDVELGGTQELTLVTASDARFLTGVAVVFASALTNLSPHYRLRAVLLACDINPERVKAFTKAMAPLMGPRFSLEVIPLTSEHFAGMKTLRPQLTIAAYGRLYIPSALKGVTKALYLDCDIIVTRDW